MTCKLKRSDDFEENFESGANPEILRRIYWYNGRQWEWKNNAFERDFHD